LCHHATFCPKAIFVVCAIFIFVLLREKDTSQLQLPENKTKIYAKKVDENILKGLSHEIGSGSAGGIEHY
jgi:hypothetical protein